MITIAIFFITVVVIGGVLFLDRQKFTNSRKQIITIAGSIKDIKEESENNFCQRNNLKYSGGSLGCTVEVSVLATKEAGSLLQIDAARNRVGWTTRGSNLISWSSVDNSYKSAVLYKNGDMDCYIRIQEKQLNEQYFTIGCYASAKWEWFFVR